MTTYPPLLRYTDSDGRKWKEVRGRPSKRKVRPPVAPAETWLDITDAVAADLLVSENKLGCYSPGPARALTRSSEGLVVSQAVSWVNAHLGLMIRILPDPDGQRFHIVADDALDTAVVHRLAILRLRNEIDAVLARERTLREMP